MRGREKIRAVLVFAVMVLCGCKDPTRWEGRYSGQRPVPLDGAVELRLEADGRGQWEIDGESTPLRWEERQGALWLHLKAGGVIVARRTEPDGALGLELPGVGPLRLNKSG